MKIQPSPIDLDGLYLEIKMSGWLDYQMGEEYKVNPGTSIKGHPYKHFYDKMTMKIILLFTHFLARIVRLPVLCFLRLIKL